MKEFFKYVFATMIGILLSTVVLIICSLIFIAIVISKGESNETVFVKNNSVLVLNLNQEITERTPDNSLANLPFIGGGEPKSIGFTDILNALKKAKTDDKIKCLYIDVSSPQAGFATMREIRNAILDFRTSKKPVIAYSEAYTQGAYYLASAANKVYINPQGILEFKGFNSQVTFFKGALDKLGIEAQVIRVGNFKSAVEPYINTKMSDYNRKQVTVYVNGLYNVFLEGISGSRNIRTDSLFNIANDYKIQQPEDALRYKLVDGLKYKDEVLNELKTLTNTDKNDNPNSVSINDYAKNQIEEPKERGKNNVAVIYANGEIMSGEGSDEQIGSERISREIRKARLDSNIKAVVLRVNSPGGSALASEVIWREVMLTKKVKPVIASFGDVAASGGYYIGCAADSILVQPNTITGSIGVFGIIPNMQKLLNNKLGITFDGVKTGKYADIMDISRPMTSGERLILQNGVNRTYDTFTSRVAEGRKKSKIYINEIGGGRVWTGNDAIKIGLADRLGDFDNAIKTAAHMAKLKEYNIVEYPEKINVLKTLLANAKDNISVYYTKKELGNSYMIYKKIQEAANLSGIQARMLYEPAVN